MLMIQTMNTVFRYHVRNQIFYLNEIYNYLIIAPWRYSKFPNLIGEFLLAEKNSQITKTEVTIVMFKKIFKISPKW